MVFAPVLDDFEELLVGVVPGVAGLIVRWGREIPQQQALAPVGLAFEIASVTASAKAGVPLLAQGDVLGVVGVGLASGGICWRLDDYHLGQAWGYATQDNEQNTQPTEYRKNTSPFCAATPAARLRRRPPPCAHRFTRPQRAAAASPARPGARRSAARRGMALAGAGQAPQDGIG
jgi:hypothetical protein